MPNFFKDFTVVSCLTHCQEFHYLTIKMLYNRCTGIYMFGNNTYPQRIRYRSNLGHIFGEKMRLMGREIWYMLGDIKKSQIWLPTSFLWWNLWKSQAIESPAYCSYIPLVSILLEWCDRFGHEVWLKWGLLTTPTGRPDSTRCDTSYINKWTAIIHEQDEYFERWNSFVYILHCYIIYIKQ